MKNSTLSLLCYTVAAFSFMQGKTVILSGNQMSSFLQEKITMSSNTAGILNKSFGNTPSTVLGASCVNGSIGGNATVAIDYGTALAVQDDGKIVLGGYCNFDYNIYFALARFMPDGTLDTDFGVSGTQGALTTVIPGTVFINQSICGTPADSHSIADKITSVVIQSDGNIVVAGTTFYWTDSANATHCTVARFMPNGTLDTSFGVTGTEGALTTLIPGTVFVNQSITGSSIVHSPTDSFLTIVLQNDGKLILGGMTNKQVGGTKAQYAMVARFMSDGALDTSFGVTGTYNGITSLIPGTLYLQSILGFTFDSNTIYDQISSIALQSDGAFVVTGYAGNYDEEGEDEPILYWMLARLWPNGTFDTSFVSKNDAEGVKTVLPGTLYFSNSITGSTLLEEPSQDNFVTGIVLQPDGKIVIGGQAVDTNFNAILFGAARFMPDGSLDVSFGSNSSYTSTVIPGTVYIRGGICGSSITSSIAQDTVNAISLQADGKIVLAGATFLDGIYQARYIALVRFLPTGLLDESFGANATSTTTIIPGTVFISKSISGLPFDSGQIDDSATALAVLASGQILVGGSTQGDSGSGEGEFFALAEFFNPINNVSYKKSYSSVGGGLNC